MRGKRGPSCLVSHDFYYIDRAVLYAPRMLSFLSLNRQYNTTLSLGPMTGVVFGDALFHFEKNLHYNNAYDRFESPSSAEDKVVSTHLLHASVFFETSLAAINVYPSFQGHFPRTNNFVM